MEPEKIDVAPSPSAMEETPVVAPSEQPISETPAEPVEAVAPTEPELYELPDGRKVDAGTVAQEYKNLLTDYTKKSQTLAEIEKSKLTTTTEKPYQDPDWQPQTYAELIEIAKQEVRGDFEREKQAIAQHQEAIENQVVAELQEIKAIDANVNENALFIHATKYGFKDLKLAHQNMKDMADVVKKTQQVTADNIAKRQDPVSISPGSSGQKLDPSHYGSARDYLKALKGTG